MAAQTIHMRIFNQGVAGIACSQVRRAHGTSSPDRAKVNCLKCKAVIAEVERRQQARAA